MTDRPTGEPQDAAPPATAPCEDEPVAATPDDLSPTLDDLGDADQLVEEGAPLEPRDLDDLDDVDDVEAPDLGDIVEPGLDAPADADRLERALAERTADLQRLQAEYVNYKRRVDRDRELVRENATYTALAPIAEVLDTIDRARESARSLGTELDAGFQAVADQLDRAVAKAGLVKYGEPGDAFDPRLHEALSHIGEDPDVEVTTCKIVAKAGYRIGDRVVRAAQVLVVDPAPGG